jgi:hypothetical protein
MKTMFIEIIQTPPLPKHIDKKGKNCDCTPKKLL